MKPARPVAHVTLGGRRLSMAEGAVADVQVWHARSAHDRTRVTLWRASKFAGASPGDALVVEMGDEDSESTVWTGTVSEVRARPEYVVVEGLAPTAALSRERKSQTYLNQGAGDVVRDLASPVDIDEVDTQLELDAYAVDSRRSVWGHLLDLAQLAGAEVSVNPEGKLRFVDVRSRPSSKKFRYGADILEWALGPAAGGTAAKYAPHGSASSAGKEKWHWINQEPATEPVETVGAFHAQNAADALTEAAKAAVDRGTIGGTVRVVGDATLRTGDVVALEDLPDGPGDVRVVAVTHRFNGRLGFVTDAVVEGPGGSGTPL